MLLVLASRNYLSYFFKITLNNHQLNVKNKHLYFFISCMKFIQNDMRFMYSFLKRSFFRNRCCCYHTNTEKLCIKIKHVNIKTSCIYFKIPFFKRNDFLVQNFLESSNFWVKLMVDY